MILSSLIWLVQQLWKHAIYPAFSGPCDSAIAFCTRQFDSFARWFSQHNFPLHGACRSDELEAVRRVLQSGEQHVDKRNLGGETALSYTARLNKKNAVRIARLLVQARADVNKTDNDQATPLCRAVMHKNYDLLVYLVDRGAESLPKTSRGQTTRPWRNVGCIQPLHVAVLNDDLQTLQFLVERAGAPVSYPEHVHDAQALFLLGRS